MCLCLALVGAVAREHYHPAMAKFFNNAGPSVPGRNFMVDPLDRIDVQAIDSLIADERYFVLHAPRQT